VTGRELQFPSSHVADAVDTVTWAPDDWWRYHPKHVQRFTDI